MALKTLVLALGTIAAASPLSAAGGDRSGMAAPAGTFDTLYCMRVDATTGSRVEQVRCWTREQWAGQGVDVDRDWAENGVRTIG